MEPTFILVLVRMNGICVSHVYQSGFRHAIASFSVRSLFLLIFPQGFAEGIQGSSCEFIPFLCSDL